MFAVSRVQCVVVELQREEGVDQSAERHPVTPAGREVLDVYVLTGKVEISVVGGSIVEMSLSKGR